MNTPRCCLPGCGLDADFEIIENRTDVHPADAFTHACEAHVGKLVGSHDGRTSSWTLVPLGIPAVV